MWLPTSLKAPLAQSNRRLDRLKKGTNVVANVRIKSLEAFAEIVQPGLALWRFQNAIARTLSPAQIQMLTTAASLRQCIALGHPKAHLLSAKGQLCLLIVKNVAQPMTGIDKVVAGKHV